MPAKPRPDASLDLFSAPASALADRPVISQGREGRLSPPRYLLPGDLAGALKHLNDREVDALLAAVTSEAERRGRATPKQLKACPQPNAKPRRPRAPVERSPGSLTIGKLNAVRAAFKAGIKPLAIAKQFGLSQSDVRSALATESSARSPAR